MTNKYPYEVIVRCDNCGKTFKVTYYDDEVRMEAPVCNCNSTHSVVSGVSYDVWKEMREQDKKEMYANLDKLVIDMLDEIMGHDKTKDGYKIEIYADYRDEMSADTAAEILESEYPMDELVDLMFNWYADWDTEIDELIGKVLMGIKNKYTEYDSLSDLNECVEEIVRDNVYFEYPTDHYLEQEFKVPIYVDTGDGNYDFTLNTTFDEDNEIDDKAAVVWLAKQQGYTKERLWAMLQKKEENEDESKGFLPSIHHEIYGAGTDITALTFLLKMSLRDLIKLNELIKLQESNGVCYDATKRPDCGKITISKDTVCGLYDSWNGGGSYFEINLEKDVVLPIKFIHSAIPDQYKGRYCYGVDNCYGFCSSVWEKGSVVSIEPPKYTEPTAA